MNDIVNKVLDNSQYGNEEQGQFPEQELKERLKSTVNDRKTQKQGLYEIAKHLIKKYNVKTVGNERRRIYIYQDGYYQLDQKTLENEIDCILEEVNTSHYSKEIIKKITYATPIEISDFNVDKKYINLNNGILNWETGELIDHDPQYLFIHKLPLNFDPNADCPNIKKFLGEVLNDEYTPIIYELAGYILYRGYPIKKGFLPYGEKNTGKTTLLRLLTKFIGKKNTSSISLHKLSSSSFSAAALYNKHINIYDDLSFRDITDTGAFKMATGGGYIPAEVKFGESFSFENYSKLLFACNRIPDVKDTKDDAYFDRWIPIPFKNSFKELDLFLIDKLIEPNELSGFLNYALDGLRTLMKNRKFSYSKDSNQVMVEMLSSSSSVAAFAFSCLEESGTGEDWISKRDMYDAFVNFANNQDYDVKKSSENSCGRDLQKYAPYISDYKPTDPENPKKQITAWRGVILKDKHKKDENDPIDEGKLAF